MAALVVARVSGCLHDAASVLPVTHVDAHGGAGRERALGAALNGGRLTGGRGED